MYFEFTRPFPHGCDNARYELTIATNKAYEAIKDIYEAIATSPDALITIADDGLSIYVSEHITACAAIETNNGDADFDPGWNGSNTRIKILPRDFIADDGGRPVMIDDTGGDRWVESDGTSLLFASIPIPKGFAATHVNIYGSATSAIVVYEADINSKTVTSRGTGNIQTPIDIDDVNSDTTNYLLIQLAQASGEEVYGGYVTIAMQ